MIKKLSLIAFFVVSGMVYAEDKPATIDDYLNYSAGAEVDSINSGMLNEVAETFGFRGGKAERSAELLAALEKYSRTLDLMYRFEPLVDSKGFLPPVITESKDVAHITDSQMRTGAKVYEIIRPERFVSNPPSWRSYLIVGLYSSTDRPESATLPKNSDEKKIWKAGVVRGWQKGREDADRILETNFNRLTRDYNGMLRYSSLLQNNMVKPPLVTESSVTVTGDDNKMILGDKTSDIKKPAHLNTNKREWKPSVSTGK